MKKITNLVIAGLVSMTFATGSAMAFGQSGPGGFSIGIIGVSSTFDTTGSETEGPCTGTATNCGEISSTSVSTDADFGSGFIEYTAYEEGTLFGTTIGIEFIPGKHSLGAKSRTDTSTTGGAPTDDDGTYTAKAEVSQYATLYIEPTIMAGNNFGVYLKGGISHVKVSTLEDIALGADASSYGNAHVMGAMYGAGIKFGNVVFVKLEATKTQYESVKFQSLTGNQNVINATPEQESVRLAIGLNF